METKNVLPLTGIAFVALIVAMVALSIGTGIPDSRASAAEVASYYDEHGVLQFLGSFVLAAAVPFLVLFALGVAAARRAEDGRTVWEWMLVGGSVMTGAVLLVLAMTNLALVDAAGNDASAGALEALNALSGSVWVAHNAGLGVMMVGAAGTFLAKPRIGWLGWSALAIGIALFIPFADFFALLLTAPWLIAAGVALSRRAEPRHRIAEPATSLS
jgi:hypothetical protein